MKRPRQSFVVILKDKDTGYNKVVYGPFRSFKKAEGVAKAEDGNGISAYVEPITKPLEYMK